MQLCGKDRSRLSPDQVHVANPASQESLKFDFINFDSRLFQYSQCLQYYDSENSQTKTATIIHYLNLQMVVISVVETNIPQKRMGCHSHN